MGGKDQLRLWRTPLDQSPPAAGVAGAYEPLYARPMESRRTGPFYNAFSYPTKIDPEAIAVFIATHTRPGDSVLDVFGGSGATGVAVRLCDRPTERMRILAKDYRIRPAWGPRRAMVYELSPIGALLGSVMSNPPAPAEFSRAAKQLVQMVEREIGWMYSARSPGDVAGRIRYVIWSESLRTPCCGHRLTLWDAAAEREPAVLKSMFACPNCGADIKVDECERLTSEISDPITGRTVLQRERVPAWVYGRSNRTTWSRPLSREDLTLIEEVESQPLGPVPSDPIYWGDLHRTGYHRGIDRFHHLYTPRNLRAMAAFWRGIDRFPRNLRDALRLVVLSYNASHSTLLTRIVAKKNKSDFAVTGAQSGVLYVSGLPVEKNVVDGVRRKIRTFARAFAQTRGSRSDVRVVNASSTQLDLADNSIDYVFTDPPFGDFIPYAEVNQINEAWLGRLTDRRDEAIVSPAQNKGIDEYAELLKLVFAEVARVLKPTGAATIVFHASKPAIWQAVGDAFRSNGFGVERTSVLDKKQVSFKQVVSAGGTRGDALFLLRPLADSGPIVRSSDHPDLIRFIGALEAAAEEDPTENEPRRMYSRYVAQCMELDVPVAISAPDFYQLVWRLRRAKGAENREPMGAAQ